MSILKESCSAQLNQERLRTYPVMCPVVRVVPLVLLFQLGTVNTMLQAMAVLFSDLRCHPLNILGFYN